MINEKDIYEVKAESLDLLAASTNGEIRFRGNVAYDKVIGVNIYCESYSTSTSNGVTTKTNIAEYNGNVKIAIREAGGSNRVVLPSIPYRLIKHSADVKFADRFLELGEIKGNGQDVVVSIDKSNDTTNNITTHATLLYSKL